jgi:hypothetical protein
VTDEYAREQGAEDETKLAGASVWTISKGQIAAVDFYADRTSAFKAVA